MFVVAPFLKLRLAVVRLELYVDRNLLLFLRLESNPSAFARPKAYVRRLFDPLVSIEFFRGHFFSVTTNSETLVSVCGG